MVDTVSRSRARLRRALTVSTGGSLDGTVTAGRKGIPYLRDHFEPEMSALASEPPDHERDGPDAVADDDLGATVVTQGERFEVARAER